MSKFFVAVILAAIASGLIDFALDLGFWERVALMISMVIISSVVGWL